LTITAHATVLLVEDVRRATDYYRHALGFEVDLYDRIPEPPRPRRVPARIRALSGKDCVNSP
jgi:hypothetical protein